MDISQFTARLLLIFFPGIVCCLLVDALTPHYERKPFQFVIQSFVLGILSYTLYALAWFLNSLCAGMGIVLLRTDWWPEKVEIFSALFAENQAPNMPEVVMAALYSIPLGLIVSAMLNKNVVHRIANRIGVSNDTGELDIWSFTFNSPDIEWAVFRDLEHDLVYEGWVKGFSGAESPRELLLHHVKVYNNNTGEELYSVDAAYLCRNKQDCTIEFKELFLPKKPTLATETMPTLSQEEGIEESDEKHEEGD